MPKTIHLHPNDNIVIAAEKIDAKSSIIHAQDTFQTKVDINLGHKIAVREIEKGEVVYKYGQVIGSATCDIAVGDWVHSHNLQMHQDSGQIEKATQTPPPPEPITGRTFEGYLRASGKAGTRNYIAIISTVNCSASVSKYVARHFTPETLAEFPNVDGVFAMTHQSGCGMKMGGQGHEMLTRVLGGMAKHPNVGGYLIIGLGCEQASAGMLVNDQQLIKLGEYSEPMQKVYAEGGPPILTLQETGGTAKTIEAGIEAVKELLPEVNKINRQPIPVSELCLATECGGSDGNSGVTANPALGYASDLLVAHGGTSILGETSEIYGAEHLLTQRAASVKVADKLLERIEWWKWYVGVFGADLDNNPSIGNKAGGLTTIAEKSLGAVAKGGTTALCDVYQYAEQVTKRGFVIMDTPGYDPSSVVGMVAGGANIVVFTTGRGSCFGCKPAPSIKVATNSEMYHRMKSDMDLNAGEILNGETIEQVGTEIFEEMIRVASGKQTKSEELGYGDEEFIPWIVGPVL